jgi:CheY-like chemotaxis protein
MRRRPGHKVDEREKSGLLDILCVSLIIWHLLAMDLMAPQMQPFENLSLLRHNPSTVPFVIMVI